jgi:hypothetical protein
MSITQWFDRNGVSGWLRKLLDVAYTTEMGLEIDQQSALNFLTFVGTEDKDAFRIFGESDERFHVRGGNDPDPAHAGGKDDRCDRDRPRTGSDSRRGRRLRARLPQGRGHPRGTCAAGDPGLAVHPAAQGAGRCRTAGAEEARHRATHLRQPMPS